MLVIANKDAGSTETEAISQAVGVLREAGKPVEVEFSSDAKELDQLLAGRGDRTVVVAGGDGSLHTIVSTLYARRELSDCPLGLLPLGTGNDLARGLGIPLDPGEAARIIVDGVPHRLDLLVDDSGDVAVNAVHVGVGAEAAQAADPWKPRLGPLAFPVGALVAGLRTSGWRLRVEADGNTLAVPRRKVLMVGLANAPSIAGGAAQLGPAARADDGVVDVVVSLAAGPLARLGYAIGLHSGRHTRRRDVRTARAREVGITGEPFWINADGEVSGPAQSRTWRVAPGAWQLILPEPDRHDDHDGDDHDGDSHERE
jgi:diacylglycerol kinase (ATP)